VEARPDDEGARLSAHRSRPWTRWAEEAITSLKIFLSNERPIDGIKTLLKNGLSGQPARAAATSS